MGCTRCGTDLKSIELIVKDLIRQMIEAGQLQEGLVDCTDNRLWRNTRVLTCDLLTDAICQLIKNGDICLATPQALTVEKQADGSHKISLLMSDGAVIETTARLSDGVLENVTYDSKTKKATFTVTGGGHYELNLKDDFDAVTYTYTAQSDGSVKITNGKGELVATIPAGQEIKVKAVKGTDGNVTITNQDDTTVDIPIGDVTKRVKALEDKPEFALSDHVDNTTVRVNSEGKLEAIHEKCAVVTNLNTLKASSGNIARLGFSCFSGGFSANDANTTIGMPKEFGQSGVSESVGIASKDDITSGLSFDFTGWQIATAGEVTQYVYSGAANSQTGWVRSNDEGMNPDGTLKNPVSWSKWSYELNLPKQPEQKAGLDCAEIAKLPEATWKKGTTLLAQQDGQCVRLVSMDAVFQEVGVGIVADKTTAFAGEEYKVVVTVTNTGEGKNELTNLNIAAPANTSDYEIKDVSNTYSAADEVEKLGDLSYNIKGLKRGGNVKVKFTVVPKVLGNYQFTASINPNTSLDRDNSNNTATVILNAQTRDKGIVGENCPQITLTEKSTGVVLAQVGASSGTNPLVTSYAFSAAQTNLSNIIKGKRTLKGLEFTSSVELTAVAIGKKDQVHAYGIGSLDGSVYAFASNLGLQDSSNSSITPIAPDARFGLATPSLEVSGTTVKVIEDVTAMLIAVRPRASNCYWQVYVIYAEGDPLVSKINVTNLVGGVLTETKTPNGFNDNKIPGKTNLVPGGVKEVYNIKGGYVSKQVVTVKAGTAASATLDFGTLQKFYSSGLVEITGTSLTVSANAKATDSVRSTYLDVIIED
jgi:hypothetical protein